MLTLKQCIELKERLVNGTISYNEAEKVYWENYDESKKSWHTKEWKERRLHLIKDECTLCGRRDDLLIQHLSHPKKWFEYIKDVTAECAQMYIGSNPVVDHNEFYDYLNNNYIHSPLPLCPKCNGRHPSVRARRKPKYLCRHCLHEFTRPIFLSLKKAVELFFSGQPPVEIRGQRLKSSKFGTEMTFYKALYWFHREVAASLFANQIAEVSFMRLLDDNIKYLSFDDAITACKKCAFNKDINNMDLCPECKKNYKKTYFKTCFECLPKTKSHEVRESINFEKGMQELLEDIESRYSM